MFTKRTTKLYFPSLIPSRLCVYPTYTKLCALNAHFMHRESLSKYMCISEATIYKKLSIWSLQSFSSKQRESIVCCSLHSTTSKSVINSIVQLAKDNHIDDDVVLFSRIIRIRCWCFKCCRNVQSAEPNQPISITRYDDDAWEDEDDKLTTAKIET